MIATSDDLHEDNNNSKDLYPDLASKTVLTSSQVRLGDVDNSYNNSSSNNNNNRMMKRKLIILVLDSEIFLVCHADADNNSNSSSNNSNRTKMKRQLFRGSASTIILTLDGEVSKGPNLGFLN